jgi:hypothetical protein
MIGHGQQCMAVAILQVMLDVGAVLMNDVR